MSYRVLKLSFALIAALTSTVMVGCATSVEEVVLKPPALEELDMILKDGYANSEGDNPDDPEGASASSTPAAKQPSSNSKPSGNNSNTNSNSGSSAQAHAHSWVYHEAQYDTIWHDAVTKDVMVCQACGAHTPNSSHMKQHALNGESTQRVSETIVITPAYEEDVLVKSAYYSCSCGATK